MDLQSTNRSFRLGDECVVLDEMPRRPIGPGRIEGRYTFEGEKFNIRLRDDRLMKDIGIERVRVADD